MIDVLFLGVGVFALAVGIWRVVRARRTGAGAGLAVSLIALGAAFCFLANRAQLVESEIYPSLGRLLSNLATMVAAYGIGLTVAEISGTRDRGRRTRLVALAVALALLTVMFFGTRGLPRGVGVFDELYRTHPTLVVYVFVYTAYLGFAVLDIGVVAAVTIRASGGALRAGLAVLLLASAFAVAYLAGKVVATIRALQSDHPVQALCRGPFSTLPCALDVGFPAVSVLLIVVGLTIPAIPGLAAARRDAKTLRLLRPLREHLTRRFPDIVRIDPGGSSRRERLLTAMSETNDGLILAGVTPGLPARAAARLVRDLPDEPGETEPPAAAAEPFAADVARLRAIARAYRKLDNATADEVSPQAG
ncbi:hypothetical protein [Amycolatopsis australiensis]|uniref:Integral membrane protein n=1 Tax=Amycolatopsis australiensis TaxID=546364 RepID=A0A1K1SGF6_9PSEU|nr:hypothetical protein [Amycolatopsis australiensis]SFW82997.1 hypothetical protein SAMN04489730_5556 [Amycolatopsis australiensis]